jgi:translation initiation factor 2B subunit (eIF-2B alpha/beta/delta family)
MKTDAKGLKSVRFVVTSMTRKTENVKSLRKLNSNSSENSPHLYGNAFDISYKRITARKFILTNCDSKYLKDALGEVIWRLKQEKKCWATYERSQNCYHIVAR